MTIGYTANWELWKMACENQELDPYKTKEFSLDIGGGRTRDFEYAGDVPEKEDSK